MSSLSFPSGLSIGRTKAGLPESTERRNTARAGPGNHLVPSSEGEEPLEWMKNIFYCFFFFPPHPPLVLFTSFPIASTPPTTSPGPPTTESYSDLWPNRNGNDSSGGLHHHHGQQHPNSYSVHAFDRNSKYSSNLNDIDRSEQKSFDTKVIQWPPETIRNNQEK
ncbi:Dgri\GH13645-PA-like protein [Anopheles sinensis]|uniref:Dgri\GH13645-PA-like protein n=1 Tax=Anopheles sinensis TaxID=74873 RepID=A0A084VCM5_ANOSI|nr:Dgri\GH13645-PA-like protein [Anopheles sinensis]